MKRVPLMGVLLAGLAVAGPAAAVTTHDEAGAGDFKNTGGDPTLVSLVAGDNDIIGTTGADASFVIDRDYFTFEVPANAELTALTVLPGTAVVGSDDFNQAFFAIQAGATMTVSPVSGSPAGLLGHAHYNGSDIGTNILPRIGGGFGATGFSGALGPGDYTVWIQDFNPGASRYAFRFTLVQAPVPEPATWMLTALGVGWIAARGRRRR